MSFGHSDLMLDYETQIELAGKTLVVKDSMVIKQHLSLTIVLNVCTNPTSTHIADLLSTG